MESWQCLYLRAVLSLERCQLVGLCRVSVTSQVPAEQLISITTITATEGSALLSYNMCGYVTFNVLLSQQSSAINTIIVLCLPPRWVDGIVIHYASYVNILTVSNKRRPCWCVPQRTAYNLRAYIYVPLCMCLQVCMPMVTHTEHTLFTDRTIIVLLFMNDFIHLYALC